MLGLYFKGLFDYLNFDAFLSCADVLMLSTYLFVKLITSSCLCFPVYELSQQLKTGVFVLLWLICIFFANSLSAFYLTIILLKGSKGLIESRNSCLESLASPSRSILLIILRISFEFILVPCFLKKFFKFVLSMYP